LTYAQQHPDTVRTPRKDIIDVLLKLTRWDKLYKKRNSRKISFSLIPIPSALVGGDEFIVSSINAAFYLGDSSSTNLSNIYFIPYTNFYSRIGFIINPNIWTNGKLWNLTGDFRIIHNDLRTYGLGGNTSKENQDQINHQFIRIYLTGNHRVDGPFYAGVGYNLDDFYNVSEIWSGSNQSNFSKYGIGTGRKTVSSGITFDLLWDSRKNSINPENGVYSILLYRLNTRWLGSDYTWASIYFDNRKYFSFSDTRHEVLGFRLFYWGSYGDVPYLNLPGTTLDLSARSGRGYSVARYLGKQELYAETEYRFDIARNGLWGGVLFSDAQTYTEPVSHQFEYILPAIGAGVRLKFNKKSNTNISFDMAFGKNSFQLHLNLGELF